MTKPVLLTVDDDADVLAAVTRDLRKRYGKDYRVMRADSGVMALELLGELQKRSEHLALALSDQRMPRMDGVSLLAEARKLFPRARRMLLTAYADIDAAVGAINESRLDYYLLKPWNPPEEKLYPVLDEMLESWQASFRPGYGGVRVVSERWSARGHQLRDFLARNQVPYEFLDVDASADARALASNAAADGDGRASLPLVILPDGTKLSRPDPVQVAERIGLKTKPSARFYDLAIVGAGPAGLASAVYGGSEGLRTVLVEREAPGGQAGTSSRIENYLGFPSGISGGELARRAVDQARKFGVEILTPAETVGLRVDGPYKHLTLSDGSEIACHVLMLSMGVSWNRLPAEGADRLAGAGVYYGAAMTEAPLVKGRTICIVGGGNSAGQAAMYFKDYAEKIVMILRGDSLSARMSHYLVDRIERAENIEVRLGQEISACRGDERLRALEVVDRGTRCTQTFETSHLFAFLGARPRTAWLDGSVAKDERGFIRTGSDLNATDLRGWPLGRPPYLLETSVPGIFASGDARLNSVKRVASAVGEGSVAVYFMHQFLAAR